MIILMKENMIQMNENEYCPECNQLAYVNSKHCKRCKEREQDD